MDPDLRHADQHIRKVGGFEMDQDENEQVFRPLLGYLGVNHAKEKEDILSFMMYMGEFNGGIHFKNQVTRRYIVFDRNGNLLNKEEDALYWHL
jgi:hypothetical protein